MYRKVASSVLRELKRVSPATASASTPHGQSYHRLHTTQRYLALEHQQTQYEDHRSYAGWSGLAAMTAAFVVYASTSKVVHAEEKSEEKSGWISNVNANYQNRIREFSTPEKIFETFASVTKGNTVYMTIEDFRDSLLPATYSDRQNPIGATPDVFKLADTDGDGLISFSEYIFFTTLLAIPKKHYRIAFQMFDTNQDGTIDHDEFVRVMAAMRNSTGLGQRQKSSPFGLDPRQSRQGDTVDESSTGVLDEFFGKDRSKPLSYKRFEEFMTDLSTAVLQMEFDRHAQNGLLSASDFAMAIVGYARPKQVNAFRKRVESLSAKGSVSFQQFKNYQTMLQKLPEIAIALNLYGFTEGEISKELFVNAVRAVAGVELTSTQVDVIFEVFDQDGDGSIDFEELLDVIGKRADRGLQHEREFGVLRWLQCVWNCGHQ